jgi:ribosomal protein S18 acetylase RimI-like enzyme
MPGRSDAEERGGSFASREGLGRGEAGSRGPNRGGERSRGHSGVGIDGAAPTFAEGLEGVDQLWGVRPGEFGTRRGARGQRDKRVVETGGGGSLRDRREASDAFGMSGTGVVTGERRVVGHQEHRPRVIPVAAQRSGRTEERRRDRQVRSGVVASRTGERTLRFAGGWARVGPWREHRDVAHLVLSTESVASAATVAECVARLRRDGYRSVVTSPLTEAAAAPFLAAGFGNREHLHLLAHPLEEVARFDADRPPVRRAWRRDRAAVLDIDAHAFLPSWQLGPAGLREALRATPSVRFRVGHHRDEPSPVAYAVTGRAGHQGYLQRLAVHPSARGRGFGRALIDDGLRWVRRGGARRCLVNTQEDNHDALALYEGCGFERLPTGLAVLSADL